MACLYTYIIDARYPAPGPPDLIDMNHVTWRQISDRVWGVVEPYDSNRIGIEAHKEIDSDYLQLTDANIPKYMAFIYRRADLDIGANEVPA